jgi:hypothetical protein
MPDAAGEQEARSVLVLKSPSRECGPDACVGSFRKGHNGVCLCREAESTGRKVVRFALRILRRRQRRSS